jgi:hypothetical protein
LAAIEKTIWGDDVSRRGWATVLAMVGVVVLALPGVAAATTKTVGANLSQSIDSSNICEGELGKEEDCGAVLVQASSPNSATRSAVDGIVTHWRVAGATAVPGYGINVVGRASDGTWTVNASSEPVTPSGEPVETFSTNLTIHAGEYVELNFPYEGGITGYEGEPTEAFFRGGLHPGESRTATFEEPVIGVIGFNADIDDGKAPPTAPPALPVAPIVPLAPAPTHCVVPNLQAKKLKAAKKKIRAAGCKVGIVSKAKGANVASAKVTKQSPKPGKSLAGGGEVSLKLGEPALKAASHAVEKARWEKVERAGEDGGGRRS